MPTETPHSIYLLKGKEPVRRNEALNGLIDRLTDAAFRDFDLQRIEAREATAEAILGAAAGVPFASERKVTVIGDAQNLRIEIVEKVQKLLPTHLGPSAVLIFVAGETEGGRSDDEGSKGARAAGVVRRLENLAKAHGKVLTFNAPDKSEVQQWVDGAVRAAGKTIEPAARMELMARSGFDLGALSREVEKLSAFTGDRPQITKSDVLTVVPESTEYSVFTLVDAVSEGRASVALHALRGLRVKNEPAQRILAMLSRQLRLVWQAKMLIEDRSAASRLPNDPNFLKQHPFVQDKARKQAQRITWEKLRTGFRLLLDRDLALKGIEGPPADEDEAMETLIVALCGRG